MWDRAGWGLSSFGFWFSAFHRLLDRGSVQILTTSPTYDFKSGGCTCLRHVSNHPASGVNKMGQVLSDVFWSMWGGTKFTVHYLPCVFI